jgi:hypothetical protein
MHPLEKKWKLQPEGKKKLSHSQKDELQACTDAISFPLICQFHGHPLRSQYVCTQQVLQYRCADSSTCNVQAVDFARIWCMALLLCLWKQSLIKFSQVLTCLKSATKTQMPKVSF